MSYKIGIREMDIEKGCFTLVEAIKQHRDCYVECAFYLEVEGQETTASLCRGPLRESWRRFSDGSYLYS